MVSEPSPPARTADHTDAETLAQRTKKNGNTALTRSEAEAAALLKEDGWTIAELEMVFEAGERAIRRAIKSVGAGCYGE